MSLLSYSRYDSCFNAWTHTYNIVSKIRNIYNPKQNIWYGVKKSSKMVQYEQTSASVSIFDYYYQKTISRRVTGH